VLADGSAHFTKLAPTVLLSFVPGAQARAKGCLRQERWQYGSCDSVWRGGSGVGSGSGNESDLFTWFAPWHSDVLLRCSLK
jgi:hypothetical protein